MNKTPNQTPHIFNLLRSSSRKSRNTHTHTHLTWMLYLFDFFFGIVIHRFFYSATESGIHATWTKKKHIPNFIDWWCIENVMFYFEMKNTNFDVDILIKMWSTFYLLIISLNWVIQSFVELKSNSFNFWKLVHFTWSLLAQWSISATTIKKNESREKNYKIESQ